MTVELRVHGQRLSGFQSGSVRLTMDGPTNAFELTYVGHASSIEDSLVVEGDECEVLLDGESILTGYVDTLSDEDNPGELRFTAAGRSKTADLADCSAEHRSFKNAKPSMIAAAYAEASGIGVFVEGDEGPPFPSFVTEKGETNMDAIGRICAKRGLVAYAVGDQLILGRTGARRTATELTRGQRPLMSTTCSSSWYARYSHYVFRGQVKSSETAFGKKAAQLKHAVIDPEITRYRPLILQIDATRADDLREHAEMERNRRAGQSLQVTCRVEGHQTVEGYAWRPNVLVRVMNPILRLDLELLVATVNFRFGASEPDVTELLLVPPETYDVKWKNWVKATKKPRRKRESFD
jgi:prophage tail gpP-like protein